MVSSLDEILTPAQKNQIALYLGELIRDGHGELRIVIEKGRVRILGVYKTVLMPK